MKCKRTWVARAVSLAVVMCVLSCLAMGGAWASRSELPPGLRKQMDARTPEERVVARRHLRIDSPAVDESLDMREMNDFLLTPALLVQEVVSDGVVLTYPGE